MAGTKNSTKTRIYRGEGKGGSLKSKSLKF
jgi:hypothetical protein